jgi:hypothetical protein
MSNPKVLQIRLMLLCKCMHLLSHLLLAMVTSWSHQPIGVVMKCLGTRKRNKQHSTCCKKGTPTSLQVLPWQSSFKVSSVNWTHPESCKAETCGRAVRTPLPPGRNSWFCVFPIQAMVPFKEQWGAQQRNSNGKQIVTSKLNLKWILHPEATPNLRKDNMTHHEIRSAHWSCDTPQIKATSFWGDESEKTRRILGAYQTYIYMHIVLGEHVLLFFFWQISWASVGQSPMSHSIESTKLKQASIYCIAFLIEYQLAIKHGLGYWHFNLKIMSYPLVI